jgi:hypothetical protein
MYSEMIRSGCGPSAKRCSPCRPLAGVSGTVRNSVCGVIIPPKEFGHAPAQTALHSGCPS